MNRKALYRYENFPVDGLLNKVKHVSLVNVVSPHNFTLNLEEFNSQLGNLIEEINRWCSTTTSRNATLFDFSCGTPCLARYSVDNIWYRGRVNYSVPTNETVSVYFVDFGNEDFVPKSDLRMLPPNFAKFPVHAINCGLCGADFPSGHDKWPAESMEVMQQFLYKSLRADFVAHDEKKNRYEIDLFYPDPKTDYQLSMLNRLVDLDLATSNLEYDHNTGAEDDYENTIYLRNGFIRPMLKIFDKYSADSNKEYSVDLVKYHNLEKFYLTLCDNYDKGLEVDKCLLSLYKISDAAEIPRLNFKRYRLGVGCIAKIRNSFYRCEILDFNLKRKSKAAIDDENAIESVLDLFGVDTGEVHENVPGDRVFVVADEPILTQTPHIVICCSLKGIKSTGYSSDDEIVMNKFEDFIQRRKCRFMDYIDENYQVEFLMAKGDSLGDHLVASRVALYREFQVRRKAKRYHILKKRQTRSFAKIDGLATLHIPAVQNGYLDVIISRIESTDCFYVILANMAHRFRDMNEKLMETYDNNAFRCPLLSVAKGQLCVARRSNMFQYCRAIVIENVNDFLANVYLIDIALPEIVSVANLYLMTEEFARFPPMLFECSLSNVRPSEYLNEKFLEYIANAHDICIRIDSLTDTVFDVTVFDVIFPNQNNLNDYLNNLASMHEQSHLPRIMYSLAAFLTKFL